MADYLDKLLKFTHINKAEVDQFHYWLRTEPIKNSSPETKARTKAEVFSIMMCFASRLNIPESIDEANKVSVDDLLAEIQAGTQDEASTNFLFELLVKSQIIRLTPQPKGDFDTETTFVYIEPRRSADYLNTKMRANIFDHPSEETH